MNLPTRHLIFLVIQIMSILLRAIALYNLDTKCFSSSVNVNIFCPPVSREMLFCVQSVNLALLSSDSPKGQGAYQTMHLQS